jgi:VPDSG-CTERM motif
MMKKSRFTAMKIRRSVLSGSIRWFVLAAVVAGTASVRANLMVGDTVTVTEESVNPGGTVHISSPGFYTGGAAAGIYNLKVVDGAETDYIASFCIDPWQWAPNNKSYTVGALASSPANTPPGAMGSANATEIERLWTHYFEGATTDNQAAKNLQIAIWLITGGSDFTITDSAPSGYSSWSDWLTAYETPAAGDAPASLAALNSGTYQDYVVQVVPDGGSTLMLLGAALAGFGLIRRKLAA